MKHFLYTDNAGVYNPVVAGQFSRAVKMMTGCDDLRNIDKNVLRELVDDVEQHELCDRVQKLMGIVVVGNAHDDRECWALAHEIAADDSLSLNDRLAALWKMNQLTGCDDPIDEKALQDYLSQCSE